MDVVDSEHERDSSGDSRTCTVCDWRQNGWGEWSPPILWTKSERAAMATLTEAEKATNYETFRHIERVRDLLGEMIMLLLNRAREHDQSKLEAPEVSAFTEFTGKLAATTYGSPEYEGYRAAMKPALDHHYANNRHHPEHFPAVNDARVFYLADLLEMSRRRDAQLADHVLADVPKSRITEYLEEELKVARSPVGHMTLIDLLEMLVDWKAASERHNDGNILKSIEKNADRFALSWQLERILENTARECFLKGT